MFKSSERAWFLSISWLLALTFLMSSVTVVGTYSIIQQISRLELRTRGNELKADANARDIRNLQYGNGGLVTASDVIARVDVGIDVEDATEGYKAWVAKHPDTSLNGREYWRATGRVPFKDPMRRPLTIKEPKPCDSKL